MRVAGGGTKDQSGFDISKLRQGNLVEIGGEGYFVVGVEFDGSGYLRELLAPIGFTPLAIPEMVAFFHPDHLNGLKVVEQVAPHEMARRLSELKEKALAAVRKISSSSFK